MNKKFYALSLFAISSALIFGGCVPGNNDNKGELKEPSVSFNLTEGQKIDYGTSYDAGFTVSPSSIEYEWCFKTATANLEHVKPTEIGAYSLEVVTEANSEYKSVTKAVNFEIVAGQVKATPTLTILESGAATENGLSYTTGNLPSFSYTCSAANATVEYWYSADDGETNLGTTAPTEPGVYAYNVKVVEDANYNAVSAFIWYNITAPKQDVNSMTLTFNGVEYTKNNWETKNFVIGEEAPTWSVVTDPEDAESHVEFWITKDEVDVGGWPTVEGEYVFCCGIKSSDTAYNAKYIYVAFTMVAELPKEKTAVAITMTIGGKALTKNDWSVQEIQVNSSFADAIQFSTDPAEAVNSVVYKLMVEETEEVVEWDDINSEVNGTIYKITWTIDKNSKDYKDASANSYGAGTLFKFVEGAPAVKTPATITCTINGTPLVGSDWDNTYEIPVNSNFEDVIVFSTDPAAAKSDVIYRIEVGDTEVPTTWDAIKAVAGTQEYKLVWLIDPNSTLYTRDEATSAGWGAGTHFIIKDASAPQEKTAAAITMTIGGQALTGNDWGHTHEIVKNTSFADAIQFSTDPAAAVSDVVYTITVAETETPTFAWDDIKGNTDGTVYQIIWTIKSDSADYKDASSVAYGAGTKFKFVESVPVSKTKASIVCTINGTQFASSNWGNVSEIPVNSNFADVITFSTNPAEAVSDVVYSLAKIIDEANEIEEAVTWDDIKGVAGEQKYKIVWKINPESKSYERDPDTSAAWGAGTKFKFVESAPVSKTKASIVCTINGTQFNKTAWGNTSEIPLNSKFEDVIQFSTTPAEAVSDVIYRIEIGDTEESTTWDAIKSTADVVYKLVWLINPESKSYERDPDTSAAWGSCTYFKFVANN